VYEKGVVDFSAMVNIPRELQENLQKHITFGSLTVEEEQVSRNDSTVKRAYKLWDGQLIESVLMPYEDGRQTACISSQAGCAMGCVFCATGQMGFSRQLSSSEIFEQAAKFAVELRGKDKRLSNIVLMGMGEPLNNYKNVMHAISRINKELGIGARHITLSTVGIVPKIKCLADENMQVLFLCVLPSPIP
jgi:23S rRNA (adenine2503-C2)-methyltransferase